MVRTMAWSPSRERAVRYVYDTSDIYISDVNSQQASPPPTGSAVAPGSQLLQPVTMTPSGGASVPQPNGTVAARQPVTAGVQQPNSTVMASQTRPGASQGTTTHTTTTVVTPPGQVPRTRKLQFIIGADNRTRVTPTTGAPW
jgi:hypothetical protein